MNATQAAQLRRLFRVVNGGTPTSDEDNWGGGIQWATPVDLGRVHGRALGGTDRTLSLAGLRTGSAAVPAGSLVVSTRAPIGYVAETTTPTAFNQGCRGLIPSRPLDIRFYRYVIVGMSEQLQAAGQGSTFVELSGDALAQQRLPMPPLQTQRAIADFLDTETARIDALIDKKRHMIDLLEERTKAALVELACGRDGNRRPLRPSGHWWLGTIAVNWTVERLKFLARPESGHTPSRTDPELWKDCTVPWVTLNDVAYLVSHEFIGETTNQISEAGIASSSARILPAGTVVLSRDATIGRTGIMLRPMATSQHFVDWVCGPRIRPRYLWLLFRSAMQAHFMSLTDGATLRTIGVPDLLEFVVPVPTLEEQDGIIKRAAELRDVSSAAEGALRRQIVLLQDHRQALITAAVTGELEFPGTAA